MKAINYKSDQYDLKIQQNFFKLFKDKATAKAEWKLLNNLNTTDKTNALYNRFKNLKRIIKLQWLNPIHVVTRIKEYTNIVSYKVALTTFANAKKHYETLFKKYIKGNLVIEIEIDYKIINDITIYEIHGHIICEAEAYQTYMNKTKELRQGKSLVNHLVATRRCPKKDSGQSDKNYVYHVANYINKFALLKALSKRNKKALAHIDNGEYIALKNKNPSFIRSVNKKVTQHYQSFKKIFNNTTELLKFYKIWQLLKQKQLNNIVLLKHWLDLQKTIENQLNFNVFDISLPKSLLNTS